jgi:hypothetical protein
MTMIHASPRAEVNRNSTPDSSPAQDRTPVTEGPIADVLRAKRRRQLSEAERKRRAGLIRSLGLVKKGTAAVQDASLAVGT